jgi:DNA polymerase (family 10)
MASLKSDKTFDEAYSTAKRFMSLLPVDSIIAGSLRRKEPIVGDIDIVSVGLFSKYVEGATFISGGDTLRTYLFEDTQVNVMIAKPEYLGATLLYATGSGKWGLILRAKAKRKGYKLNRYGLFVRDTGELVASHTEAEIFNALDKSFVYAESRV